MLAGPQTQAHALHFTTMEPPKTLHTRNAFKYNIKEQLNINSLPMWSSK